MSSPAVEVLTHPAVVLVVVLLLTRLYCRLTLGVCSSQARLGGKTVIVTGASRGIGKAVSCDLARRGARVIMACVDMSEAEQARDDIIRQTHNSAVLVKYVDLSRLSSVRRFAEEVTAQEDRLDVLVHNAGVHSVVSHRGPTEEGLNSVWAINHYGPFLLTHLLIDLMKKTGKGRIIFTASIAHRFAFLFGGIDLNNPNPVEVTSAYVLYPTTKYANVVISNELARRLKPFGITANCLHPGLVDTVIYSTAPLLVRALWFIGRLVFFKTAQEGAQTTMHLAVSEEVEGVTGKYFSDCKEAGQAWGTTDRELTNKLWDLSETIVRLYRLTHISNYTLNCHCMIMQFNSIHFIY